jgi:prepilin-type N-terminal cleavage/methylation domain-containing protein
VITPSSPRPPEGTDSGFSLIEMVVAMFLLGVLSMSFLPLMINAMTVTVRNSTAATAAQLASSQLEQIDNLGRTCLEINAFVSAPVPAEPDGQGRTFAVRRELGEPCPTIGLPKAIPVTVTVTSGATTVSVKTTKIVEPPT